MCNLLLSAFSKVPNAAAEAVRLKSALLDWREPNSASGEGATRVGKGCRKRKQRRRKKKGNRQKTKVSPRERAGRRGDRGRRGGDTRGRREQHLARHRVVAGSWRGERRKARREEKTQVGKRKTENECDFLPSDSRDTPRRSKNSLHTKSKTSPSAAHPLSPLSLSSLLLLNHSYAFALSARLATAARTSSTAFSSSSEEDEDDEGLEAFPSATEEYRSATASAGGTIASSSLASSAASGAPSGRPHDRRASASTASATWSRADARGRGPKPRRSRSAAARAWSKRSTSISMS